MKRWCNNVDWSLENCILNVNNNEGDSKRVWVGDPLFDDSKRVWVGDPLFEYFEEGHFLF